MGIKTDRQVAITCDSCGNNWVNTHITQRQAIKYARDEGWKISKKVTCPKCKGTGLREVINE